MNQLNKIFKTDHPLIGMVHFAPLIGYKEHPGFEYIAKKMLVEAKILESAGFDGIVLENNYDLPHSEKISSQSAAMFASLTRLLQENLSIPFGVSVLWNDYETSLAICASTKASFFRAPAFVDSVKTSYGYMPARAKKIIKLRKGLGLEHIMVLADIQVKHSVMVDKRKSLTKSAKQAVSAGADAIIVTGKWTGDAPKLIDLAETRSAVADFPILVGSGATTGNLESLSKYVDGVIVGTAIKEGEKLDKKSQVNLKPYRSKISKLRAREFAKVFRQAFK